MELEASAVVPSVQSLCQGTTTMASIERDASQVELSPELWKTPPVLSTPVQSPATEGAGGYPAFPAVGEDSAPFLNAIFNVFNQAIAPTSAPSGPVGPLAYSLPGFQVPFPQATFMPYLQGCSGLPLQCCGNTLISGHRHHPLLKA